MQKTAKFTKDNTEDMMTNLNVKDIQKDSLLVSSSCLLHFQISTNLLHLNLLLHVSPGAMIIEAVYIHTCIYPHIDREGHQGIQNAQDGNRKQNYLQKSVGLYSPHYWYIWYIVESDAIILSKAALSP